MKTILFIARASLFLIFVFPITIKLLIKGEPLAGIAAFIFLGALACAATNCED